MHVQLSKSGHQHERVTLSCRKTKMIVPLRKKPTKLEKRQVKDPVEGPCVVQLRTIPTDAAIYFGGGRVGRTPKKFELGAHETMRVKLAKGGFREPTVTLSCQRKKITVRLKKKSFGGQNFGGSGDDDESGGL